MHFVLANCSSLVRQQNVLRQIFLRKYKGGNTCQNHPLASRRGSQRGRRAARQVEVVDPVADYLATLREVFDFPLLRDFIARPDFSLVFDAMHAVTGAYATPILVDALGAPASSILCARPYPTPSSVLPFTLPHPIPQASATARRRVHTQAPSKLGRAALHACWLLWSPWGTTGQVGACWLALHPVVWQGTPPARRALRRR